MSVMNTTTIAKPKETLLSLLGGKDMVADSVVSDFDLILLSKKGLKKGSFEALIRHMGISRKAFVENILNLSVKTLERKKTNDLLDTYTSSYIIEVAKVIEHAFEVFEDEGKVQRWLNSPVLALNDMKPLDLFSMPTGLAMVNNILGRIEEGVYS